MRYGRLSKFVGGIGFTEEGEALKLLNGFKEGVLDATFVHQEAFKDFCVGKVFDEGTAEGEPFFAKATKGGPFDSLDPPRRTQGRSGFGLAGDLAGE